MRLRELDGVTGKPGRSNALVRGHAVPSSSQTPEVDGKAGKSHAAQHASHVQKGAGSALKSDVAKAIDEIKASKFGRTTEGRKVIAKFESLQKSGNIQVTNLNPNIRGEWTGTQVRVNSSFKDNVHAIASELVHEATHAVYKDEHPKAHGNSIDQEMRTNTNQVNFYKEQNDAWLPRSRFDRAFAGF